MLIILGCLVALISYLFIYVFTQGGIIFVDLPSAILILVPMIFFLAATGSGKNIARYFRSSFQKNYEYTREELAGIAGAAKNTGKFIMGLGGFGFLSGIIASLKHLETLEYLGPNLAISLITLFYAITINCLVFLPLEAWAKNKLNNQPEQR